MSIESRAFESKTAYEILQWAVSNYQRVGLASSFGLEDMVVIDMVSRLGGGIKIFTLDTGRLHEETYETMERVRSKYHMEVQAYFPRKEDVEHMTTKKGFYSFRESLENRKECCRIRKVEPLQRALSNLDAWITGLRREQSMTRADIPKIMEDLDHPPLVKISPLADWTADQVMDYIEKNKVPTNPLHKKNYPSIGCAPCTRPILEGEDVRAGRWWWENPEHKECGLHKRD
ncbi:MAG: phosphoadenosine phosphosulfate reductase [Nitrospinae bacterium RIFCSPLOWO2_12_FULL_47_7]|nr:MAG: phosphoadenosine phosphosulfate reductase [Nitrospinae bacterium RIFCSPLOWO2_12_FULL_47_7]